MNRAQFIRSLAAGVGGLLVGNEALEAFERLTHRRTMFPGWSEPESVITSPLSPDVWSEPLMIINDRYVYERIVSGRESGLDPHRLVSFTFTAL